MAFHEPTLSNGVTLPGNGSDFRSAASRLGGAFKRAYAAFVEARTAAALNQLTDRQLADIGLTRADIPARARAVVNG